LQFQGLLSDCPLFGWGGKGGLNSTTECSDEIFYIDFVQWLATQLAVKKVLGPFLIRLGRSCVPLSILEAMKPMLQPDKNDTYSV
jgi:hypothetical protein